MTDETELIRRRVLALMAKRGIQQLELAEGSGVSQSVLSRLLGDKRKRKATRPSHTTISKLERYFGEPVAHAAMMPQPPGLEEFISANRDRRNIDDDEADAMRRVGAPPGRVVGEDYWSGLLLAIRTTKSNKDAER